MASPARFSYSRAMTRWFVRICAILVIFRAFTNFAKLFQGEQATLVFFGQILHGSQTTVLAALVGLFMLITGIAMLAGSKWAFPLAAAYGAYVLVNLLAWSIVNPEEFDRVGRMAGESADASSLRLKGMLLFLGYALVALGTTALPAWLLYRERDAAH